MHKTFISICLLATPLLHGMQQDFAEVGAFVRQQIGERVQRDAQQKAEQTIELISGLTGVALERREPCVYLSGPVQLVESLHAGKKAVEQSACTAREYVSDLDDARLFLKLFLEDSDSAKRCPIVTGGQCPKVLAQLLNGTASVFWSQDVRKKQCVLYPGGPFELGFMKHARWLRDIEILSCKPLLLGDYSLIGEPCAPILPAQLTELDLSNNKFTEACFQHLKHLTNLRKLVLRRNDMTTLGGVDVLGCLVELDVHRNMIAELSSDVSRLSRLENLNLRKNRLTVMPDETHFPTTLKRLDLTDNFISPVTSLVALSRLEDLLVGGNQLREFPSALMPPSLNTLVCPHNKIRMLAPEAGQLTQLTLLNVSDNDIANLSPEIGNLQGLTHFVCDYNRLSTLPACLATLHNLGILSANGNQIATVASEIGELAKLRVLDLDENQITVLPATFAQWKNKTDYHSISLQKNRITEIDQTLSALRDCVQLEGNPVLEN